MACIYLLTNPTLEGIVKVGRIESLRALKEFVDEISAHEAAASSFDVARVFAVPSSIRTLQTLRQEFQKDLVEKERSFYFASIDDIASRLKYAAERDVTKEYFSRYSRERALAPTPSEPSKPGRPLPPFRFSMVNVPIGSVLTFETDGTIVATVCDDSHIIFKGRKTNLSRAALEVMRSKGINRVSAQGPRHWLYKGERLSDRRKRMESKAIKPKKS